MNKIESLIMHWQRCLAHLQILRIYNTKIAN